MKSFTLFPMHNHSGKVIGVIISGMAFFLLCIQKLAAFNAIKQYNYQQRFQLCLLLISLGLFIIAFSKEKMDDDRVIMMRGKALQAAFGVFVSMIAGLSFVSIVSPFIYMTLASYLPGVLLLILFIYLLIFNIGLYADSDWIHANETVLPNIRKNKLFFIVYLTILIALSSLIAFL